MCLNGLLGKGSPGDGVGDSGCFCDTEEKVAKSFGHARTVVHISIDRIEKTFLSQLFLFVKSLGIARTSLRQESFTR